MHSASLLAYPYTIPNLQSPSPFTAQLQPAACAVRSYMQTIGNDGVLEHADDAVIDDEPLLCTVRLPYPPGIGELHLAPNARITVDDRTLDDRAITCTPTTNSLSGKDMAPC